MSETRQQKAQRLVDEEAVHIQQILPQYTQALVQGDHARYVTTTYASGSFFCTCAWGENHNYSDDLCAHALAVRLAVEKETGNGEDM